MTAPIETVLAALPSARRNGDGYKAKCPAHQDRTPSLSVSVGDDDRVLLHCFAGCPTETVVAELGLKPSDLFFPTPTAPKVRPAWRIVATYDYLDENREQLYQVVRRRSVDVEKDFRQRRSNGNGGWTWKLNGVRRVPYRLPELIDAVANDVTVFITEGEKDADAVVAQGAVATTSPEGAGKWKPEFARYFEGADVVIVADRDEPGYAHARQVRDSLAPVARQVRVTEAIEGKDAADHLAACHSLEELAVVDVDLSPFGDTDPDPYRYLDLTHAWDEGVTRRVPEVGRREDGQCLFYLSNVNEVHGESGDGKSLACLSFAADELKLGRDVLWIDWEEADEQTVVERLKAFAVPRDAALERFHYVCPNGHAPTDAAVAALAADVEQWGVRLAVLDSVGEGLGVEGGSGSDDLDVARWLTMVPRPLAAAGAAVVSIDHVTKAGDKNLYASGSQRKRAGLTGASYLVENRIPFSRGHKGMSRLVCAKDRHGHYAKGQEVALMWVAPQLDDGIEITFAVPDEQSTEQREANAKWQIVARVVEIVGKNDGPIALSEVKAAVNKRAADVVAAIDSGVRIGALRMIPGSRGAKSLEWVRALEDADFQAVTFTEAAA